MKMGLNHGKRQDFVHYLLLFVRPNNLPEAISSLGRLGSFAETRPCRAQGNLRARQDIEQRKLVCNFSAVTKTYLDIREPILDLSNDPGLSAFSVGLNSSHHSSSLCPRKLERSSFRARILPPQSRRTLLIFHKDDIVTGLMTPQAGLIWISNGVEEGLLLNGKKPGLGGGMLRRTKPISSGQLLFLV